MKKQILMFITLVLLVKLVVAQYAQWKIYNVENFGLPDNSVRAIAIDANNIKWVGGDSGGLTEFDGTSWTTYNSSNSGLPSNCVNT